MALVDDVLAFETESSPLAADEAAHDVTGVTLDVTKAAIKAAFEIVRPQFPQDGRFVRVFASGGNSIVCVSTNGTLVIDIVPTE